MTTEPSVASGASSASASTAASVASAPARLLSVRLQGFKSFAERTHVAFGPGISAVVGPNGSGKSNLADALRWALGEQGRALRTRKSEDVIWAGSERRPALGMADVQLVLDNADGLLPVEFGVVELGRRLFRSGENEYVLNRQRVRLRDLVDLLDAAHLAENAFLFIGQGMVDQALALRPEERRPLFEDVAGVRRHERRRRRAEEQLVESEANLARVEDIAAELRPQVRRLAAQAEQQASRRDAGEELIEALLASGHARWHASAQRHAVATAALEGERQGLDAALAELAERETAAASLAERLAASAAAVEDARRTLDDARERLTTARLAHARVDADAATTASDRDRLETERRTLDARLVGDRRTAAIVVAGPDPSLEHDLRSAEAALADASRELSEARASTQVADAERHAAQRAESARLADIELARRRRAELEREHGAEVRRFADAQAAAIEASAAHAAVEATRTAAMEREAEAIARAVEAAAAVTEANDALAAAVQRQAQAGARLAGARERHAAAVAALEALDSDGLRARARQAGGRAMDDGLEVDPALAAAVAAALGQVADGVVASVRSLPELAGERGAVVVREALERGDRPASDDTRAAALAAAIREAGGGPLAAAIRRDPSGAVRALLATAAWLPDLAACLALQGRLPSGWLLVVRDGSAVVTEVTVMLGQSPTILDRRSDVARLAAELDEAVAADRDTVADGEAARAGASRAAEVQARARAAADDAGAARRRADADEAAAGRRAESTAREAAWLEAQVARLTAALDWATAALDALEAAPDLQATRATGATGAPGATAAEHGAGHADRLAVLERRVADLRAARDRLEAAWRDADAVRRDAERERARAEAGVAIAERRSVEIEAALAQLADRGEALARGLAAVRTDLERAQAGVAAAEEATRLVIGRDAAERLALAGAERAAGMARESVQRRQDAMRAVERDELEARLALDAVREQLLVELASLGEVASRHLPADLEAGVAELARRWAERPFEGDPPSPGRLAAVRRRFHELGAANPFAVEEHAALAARLEALETQRADLAEAVAKTRALIAELDGLIAGQFRATFSQLEAAFDARFRQLFGGGFAKLSLTEPGDLAATGIEITARPPGKKPQALAMLSGGERALTAVALLFAMLEVRPVPFCVLDEVDAALDEANVGRFTDALRSLARQTQFIVITHNRGTIETADALYGVTVGDDSVSRVISLRLEEATALAAHAGGAAAAPRPAREPIIPAGLEADLNAGLEAAR